MPLRKSRIPLPPDDPRAERENQADANTDAHSDADLGPTVAGAYGWCGCGNTRIYRWRRDVRYLSASQGITGSADYGDGGCDTKRKDCGTCAGGSGRDCGVRGAAGLVIGVVGRAAELIIGALDDYVPFAWEDCEIGAKGVS